VHEPYYSVICGLSGCTIFSHIFINYMISGEKLLNIKCMFYFSVLWCVKHFLSSRIQGDINVHRWSPYKLPSIHVRFNQCPLFMSDFIQTQIFSMDFRKIFISNFMKIHLVGAELFLVEGRTDRQTDMIKLIVICNFVNAPKMCRICTCN
jgi:hypothetical protein